MEPSGCNRWQPVANGTVQKRLRQAKTVAVGCTQLPESFHGKEGVDGSSPSEGSAKRDSRSTGLVSTVDLTEPLRGTLVQALEGEGAPSLEESLATRA